MAEEKRKRQKKRKKKKRKAKERNCSAPEAAAGTAPERKQKTTPLRRSFESIKKWKERRDRHYHRF